VTAVPGAGRRCLECLSPAPFSRRLVLKPAAVALVAVRAASRQFGGFSRWRAAEAPGAARLGWWLAERHLYVYVCVCECVSAVQSDVSGRERAGERTDLRPGARPVRL